MACALVVLVPLLAAAQEAPADRAAELWQAGRRAEAIEAARAELAREPEPTGLLRRVAEWEMAVHRYEAALADLEPLGPEVDSLRGEALFRLGRYEEAVAKLDASDSWQALMRVEALWALARFEQADAALEEAARVVGEEDPRVLSLQGRRLARLERHAEAAQAFRGALEKDPLLPEALFGLGQALLRSGEREAGLAALERHRALLPLLDALDFARRGVDLAPAHAPNLAALGDAERALGRLDQAEAAYREAARLAEPEQLAPIALRHARLLEEDRGDPERALVLLDEAGERSGDPRPWVRAGDLLTRLGRHLEALQRYLRAQVLRPGDPEIERRIAASRAALERAKSR